MNSKYSLFLFLFFSQYVIAQNAAITVCSEEKNDFTKILDAGNISFIYVNTALKAVQQAPKNSSVMLLSSPNKDRENISKEIYQLAQKKNLKLYIEKPSFIPDITLPDSSIKIKLERGIINSNKIKGLDSLSLLGVYDQSFIPVESKDALILLGKVAGYDKADYGIDDVKTYALLTHVNKNVLISTLNLSDFISSRFGPEKSWQQISKYIFNWLGVKEINSFAGWQPDVSPMFKPDYVLKKSDYETAVKKGSDWFYDANLFVHSSWQDLFLKQGAKNSGAVMYPAVSNKYLIGNGELGILEGHGSKIYKDGSQPLRWWIRADCQAETAYALSLSGNYLNKDVYRQTATNLLNYLYKTSTLRGGPRNDIKSPTYGLVGWTTIDDDVYYGDDNARVILGTIGAIANLNDTTWNRYLVEAIIANYRTTGKNGFRSNWFRDKDAQKLGLKALADRDLISAHPHFESWLWATYLWLYDKTGYQPFLEKAKKGISITMDKYPDWKWTNGIQQERARMILPLAWLVRVENTDKHRAWLKTVADKLLENLVECGAIREELGEVKSGRYGRPKSNAEYGLHEAPLISVNGDPVADLLYTTNFAFFALNEAAAATGDVTYELATKRIAEFLVKIQVNSKKHKELDGAWYRAFDYNRWDYWASNADSDWGPWGTLTGWTQSWIVSTLVMVDQKDNFWDATKKINKDGNFKKTSYEVINKMLPR